MKPRWLSKHACTHCTAGYGECAQGLQLNMKCCMFCNHPTRWMPEPYTQQELAEMREAQKQ